MVDPPSPISAINILERADGDEKRLWRKLPGICCACWLPAASTGGVPLREPTLGGAEMDGSMYNSESLLCLCLRTSLAAASVFARPTPTPPPAARATSACNAEVGLPDLRVARRCNGAEGLDGDPDELIPPLCPHAA